MNYDINTKLNIEKAYLMQHKKLGTATLSENRVSVIQNQVTVKQNMPSGIKRVRILMVS